jgi:hypothetical protein
VAAPHGVGNAEYIAWVDVAHHDLLAFRRDLHHLQVAVQQYKEARSLLALLEDDAAFFHAKRLRLFQGCVQIVVGQRPEQFQVLDERPADLCGHGGACGMK